jgi:hypothetical protein
VVRRKKLLGRSQHVENLDVGSKNRFQNFELLLYFLTLSLTLLGEENKLSSDRFYTDIKKIHVNLVIRALNKTSFSVCGTRIFIGKLFYC